jgi:hypothetical protein
VCEYGGCQNVPAIAAVTAQHDELCAVARVATHAARSGDRAAASVTVRRLLMLLEPHTGVEELADGSRIAATEAQESLAQAPAA